MVRCAAETMREVGPEALAGEPPTGLLGVVVAAVGELALVVGAPGRLGLAVPHHRDAARHVVPCRLVGSVRAPLFLHLTHSGTG